MENEGGESISPLCREGGIQPNGQVQRAGKREGPNNKTTSGGAKKKSSPRVEGQGRRRGNPKKERVWGACGEGKRGGEGQWNLTGELAVERIPIGEEILKGVGRT